MVTAVTVAVSALTVTVAVADFVLSSVEVAVTVSLVSSDSLEGTTRTPLAMVALLVPPLTDQVTVCAGSLAPVTVAVKVLLPPLAAVAVSGLMVTAVTVAVSALTVTVAWADFVGSAVEVTVTVRDSADSSVPTTRTASLPLPLIAVLFDVFPVSSHSNPEARLFAVAVKVLVPPFATVAVPGLTDTLLTGPESGSVGQPKSATTRMAITRPIPFRVCLLCFMVNSFPRKIYRYLRDTCFPPGGGEIEGEKQKTG
jgi:hypothetical protein